MNEDDLDGEVISVNGEDATPPTDNTPEDRGDVVAIEPAEPAADPKPDADADERKGTAGIPKARFDEVNERRKTAEQELEAAQAEIQRLKSTTAPAATPTAPAAPVESAPADAFDEDAKEQAYIDAMLDGDSAKAKEIRKEINAHLREQAAAEIETRTAARNASASLQQASAQALQDFPYLDTPDGEYALDLIVAARNASMAKGVPAHEALADAVAKIAPRFAPTDDKAPPSRGLPETPPVVDTRTKQALQRGAQDSIKQPPALQAGLGNRTDAVRVNVENLDEAQFAALTPAEKKALRGD